MGSIQVFRCETCAVERREFTGLGMMAQGRELCACYKCKRLVLKKITYNPDMDYETNLRCPYCKNQIHPLQEPAACPVCDDELVIEFNGSWD